MSNQVLVSRAPAGLNYQLQSTNQGDLEVELVEASTLGGGGSSTVAAGTTLNVDVPLNTPTNVDVDLGSFGAPFTSQPSLLLTGALALLMVPGDELPAFCVGTYEVQVSLDGGANFISGGVGGPIAFSGLGSPTVPVNLSLPINFNFGQLADITGNVIARVIVTMTDGTASNDLSASAYASLWLGSAPT
jgi:hypothetical protein